MAGSPTLSAIITPRLVVGVAELAVTNQSGAVLSTYALGSCIGLVAYDPVARAAGLLHLMLPDSTISPEKAARQPAMFADTGVPALFNALQGVRAQRSRTVLYIAGGASVLSGPDSFQIGERNAAAVRRLISVYGCRVLAYEVGGFVNRTLHLDIGTGRLTVKMPDRTLTVALG
jgi:chemotaxis protein CheD